MIQIENDVTFVDIDKGIALAHSTFINVVPPEDQVISTICITF
jgi:hypothetical protein